MTGKIADGLHMEITSLQLYSVALSAGKAQRDHKHHHVHKFDHNGEIPTTTTTPRPPVSLILILSDFFFLTQFFVFQSSTDCTKSSNKSIIGKRSISIESENKFCRSSITFVNASTNRQHKLRSRSIQCWRS